MGPFPIFFAPFARKLDLLPPHPGFLGTYILFCAFYPPVPLVLPFCHPPVVLLCELVTVVVHDYAQVLP